MIPELHTFRLSTSSFVTEPLTDLFERHFGPLCNRIGFSFIWINFHLEGVF
jgi:hypothetical protein